MGKSHCLNKNKLKEKKTTKGRVGGGSGSSQKVRKKIGEESFEKEKERG